MKSFPEPFSESEERGRNACWREEHMGDGRVFHGGQGVTMGGTEPAKLGAHPHSPHGC